MKSATKNATGIIDDASRRKISVASCIEMALSRLPGLMNQVLDSLQQAAGLQASIGKQSAGFQTDVRPAVKQLSEQRESLKNAFTGQMRVLAYGGGGNFGSRPLVRFEDIQLLDVNQLDESIELARVQQELDFAVTDQLARFHALMSTVMGWISVQPTLNPLRPELFAKALRDTLAAHVAVPEVRSEILSAAAGRLGVGVRQIYREISDSLVARGIEPAGLLAPTRTNVTASSSTDRPSETVRAVLTLERLRRLFSPESGSMDNMSMRPSNDFLHTMPASVQALQDMRQVDAMIQRLETRKKEQTATSGNAAAYSVDMLRRQPPLDGRQLGQQIGEEVTRMMLENLTQDERLLPQVRHTLQVLTPVLLELAQLDVRFFSDHKHPARQFLDRVTDRSLAYTEEGNEGYARFILSIDAAVRGIVESRWPKAFAFAKQLETLLAIWQSEDQLQMQLREETARALLHVEQRNLLAQRLLDDWQGRLADKPVPPLVRNFLLGPWAQVVAESQLNCNQGASDSQGYTALVEDLIWSTQPRQARRNPVRLVQMIPAMLSTLRSGLQLISFPPDRITQFFDELIACHESVLQEARALRERSEATRSASRKDDDAPFQFDQIEEDSSHPSTESIPLDAPWFAADETSGAGYLEAEAVMPIDPATMAVSDADQAAAHSASETITEGAWVELMLEGEWTRLKLTWSSPHRTLFMFTSTRGRAHSMSRRSMERLLAAGMIRIISAGLMLDQALDVVAQTALRNSLEAGKPPI